MSPRDICSQFGMDLPPDIDNRHVFAILRMLLQKMTARKRQEELDVHQVAVKIKNAKNIIVLSGAGISVSCGIPDFRSENGLYKTLAKDFPELPDPQVSNKDNFHTFF